MSRGGTIEQREKEPMVSKRRTAINTCGSSPFRATGIWIAGTDVPLKDGLRQVLSSYPNLHFRGEVFHSWSPDQPEEAQCIFFDLDNPISIDKGTLIAWRRQHPKVNLLAVCHDSWLGYEEYLHHMTLDGVIYLDNLARIEQQLSQLLGDSVGTTYLQETTTYHHQLLSTRELRFIQLSALGWPMEEIADHLCVGIRTLQAYRLRINKKLGTNNFCSTVAYCVSMGVIQNEDFNTWVHQPHQPTVQLKRLGYYTNNQ